MITIVLPAYNEEAVIAQVIEGAIRVLNEAEIDYEILVINDGSTDATAERALESGARVIEHAYNIGNGAAIKSGIRNAGGDVIVFMDADGQHDPADIPRLAEAIGKFDMAVGARSNRRQSATHRNLANRLYNALATYVTGQPIQDLTSGFRAIRTDVAKKFVYLLPNTFSYPTTLTLACFRTGRSVGYFPIEVSKRVGKSKIRLLVDGPRFGIIILKIATFFSPFKIFFPLALLGFTGGLANYAYTYLNEQRFTNMSMLLFIGSLLIFLLGLISDQISSLRFDRSEIEN